MMSKQFFFCPNCGKGRHDYINMNHPLSLMCSDFCLKEWQLKYARMILGKSGL